MRAVVIGNAAVDETFAVAALPRPGASIFATGPSRDLGGKGLNQAVALGRAGLATTLVAVIGADERGRLIAAGLAEEPLATRLIEAPSPSDLSLILTSAEGENAVLTTRAAAEALTPAMAEGALADFGAGDLLVLQGNLSEVTTRAALLTAKARGMRTVLNPSPLQPFHATLWPLVDSAFVNAGEAEMLGGTEAIGAGEVVMTLGPEGAVLIGPEGRNAVAARPAQVIDPTGAGDCFLAVALASAALRGTRLDARALRHAAEAAALVVSRPGTRAALPSVAEMRAILQSP